MQGLLNQLSVEAAVAAVTKTMWILSLILVLYKNDLTYSMLLVLTSAGAEYHLVCKDVKLVCVI